MSRETNKPYVTAANLFGDWRSDVTTGKGPVLFPIGTGELGCVEVGPELVLLIGGAPGTGKTAFTMQAIVDALRMTPKLRALVCNVEMSPGVLLDRQLARLSGVDLPVIRHRRFTAEHDERLAAGLQTLEAVAERLAFVRPPFTLEAVAASADDFRADLVLLDYVQRIPPPGNYGSDRAALDAAMSCLRKFAAAGLGVIVVSALSRGRDAKGAATYSETVLNLASFRGSGELEFAVDSAYLLTTGPETNDGAVRAMLRCVKARHSEPRDVVLDFYRRVQRFVPVGEGLDAW